MTRQPARSFFHCHARQLVRDTDEQCETKHGQQVNVQDAISVETYKIITTRLETSLMYTVELCEEGSGVTYC